MLFAHICQTAQKATHNSAMHVQYLQV